MLIPTLAAIATTGSGGCRALQEDATVIFASTIDFSHGGSSTFLIARALRYPKRPPF